MQISFLYFIGFPPFILVWGIACVCVVFVCLLFGFVIGMLIGCIGMVVCMSRSVGRDRLIRFVVVVFIFCKVLFYKTFL